MQKIQIGQMRRRIDTFAAHGEEKRMIGSSINAIAAYAKRTGYKPELIEEERKMSKLI